MINFIYTRYKIEICEKNVLKSICRLGIVAKGILFLVPVLVIFMVLFSMLQQTVLVLICASMIIFLCVLVYIVYSQSKFGRRKLANIILEKADERLKKTIILLMGQGIDVNDSEEMSLLIQRVKMERDGYESWKWFKKFGKVLGLYFIIPIFTVVINKYLDDSDIIQIISKTIVLACVFGLILIFCNAFVFSYGYFFNRDLRCFDMFISDLENIRVFKSKTYEIVERINFMRHNYEKDFSEKEAMRILVKYQGLYENEFIHNDKPDWQCQDNGIGIEVTKADPSIEYSEATRKAYIPTNEKEIENYNRQAAKVGVTVLEENKAKVIFGDHVSGIKNGFIYIAPAYNDDFSDIEKNLKKKLKKLNTNYSKDLKEYRLFIYSPIPVIEEMLDKEFKKLNEIQGDFERKYNIIYVLLPDALIVFDFNNGKYSYQKVEETDGYHG